MNATPLSAGAMGTLIVLAERYEGWHMCVDIVGPLAPRRTRSSCLRLHQYGLVEVKTRRLTSSTSPGAWYVLMVRVTDLGRQVARAYRQHHTTQAAAK